MSRVAESEGRSPADTLRDSERRAEYLSQVGTLPRHRATLVMRREGRILLVRDRGRSSYGLPGGGIEDGELPIVAAARELHEETGLEATAIRYLFSFAGKYNVHRVYEVEADGEAAVRGEIDCYIWWDMKDDTPVYPHVEGILARL